MLKRIRPRLSYANVMVTVLAFVVLGGGTAVALHGSNTVFSDDIVNGQVKTQDINDTNGVGSADVRDDTLENGGLQAADLRPDSVGPSYRSVQLSHPGDRHLRRPRPHAAG